MAGVEHQLDVAVGQQPVYLDRGLQPGAAVRVEVDRQAARRTVGPHTRQVPQEVSALRRAHGELGQRGDLAGVLLPGRAAKYEPLHKSI